MLIKISFKVFPYRTPRTIERQVIVTCTKTDYTDCTRKSVRSFKRINKAGAQSCWKSRGNRNIPSMKIKHGMEAFNYAERAQEREYNYYSRLIEEELGA